MPATAQIAKILADHDIQIKYTLANLTDTHLRRGLFAYFGGSPKTQQLKIELNAILSGLIPSFKNIEKHTMCDIKNSNPTEN